MKTLFGEVYDSQENGLVSVGVMATLYWINLILIAAQGEPGKPPPGYKCRRCDSTEVCVSTSSRSLVV